jgi:hypothetical protein
MATEIRSYDVTVPANTLPTAPLVQSFPMPPRIVDAIQIVVPPGPSGLVGFAVTASGLTVIPYASAQWIITAAENITWPLERQIDSGAWGVRAYNTGTNDHAIYFRFLLRPATPVDASHPGIIDPAALIAPSDIAL